MTQRALSSRGGGDMQSLKRRRRFLPGVRSGGAAGPGTCTAASARWGEPRTETGGSGSANPPPPPPHLCGPIFCPRRADGWRIERRDGRANVRCVPSTRSATSDYFSAAAPIRNRAIKSDD